MDISRRGFLQALVASTAVGGSTLPQLVERLLKFAEENPEQSTLALDGGNLISDGDLITISGDPNAYVAREVIGQLYINPDTYELSIYTGSGWKKVEV